MSNYLQSLAGAQGRSSVSPTLFGLLDEPLQRELLKDAPLRDVSAGQLIQQQGETSSGFWLIERGAVAVGQYLAHGEFRAIAHLQAGDSYGELAWFSGRARVVDAVARTAARLYWIEGPKFERVLNSNPAAMRQLLGGLSLAMQETLDLVAGHRGGGGTGRIALFLRNLSASGPEVALGQQELADLAGVTRATANAALKRLEAAGAIQRGYRRITVLDRDRLSDWT